MVYYYLNSDLYFITFSEKGIYHYHKNASLHVINEIVRRKSNVSHGFDSLYERFLKHLFDKFINIVESIKWTQITSSEFVKNPLENMLLCKYLLFIST